MPYGFDVANALKTKYKDSDLWDNISEAVEKMSSILPKDKSDIIKKFDTNTREDVADILLEQKIYLRLLSRITLTLPQAKLLLGNATSDKQLCEYADQLTNIHNRDLSADIIENPYILFEKTYRLEEKYRIGIGKIDLALFPPEFVSEQFFTGDDENRVVEQNDKRRLRAVIVSVLEQEAANGSSLMLASRLIEMVSKFRSDVPDIEPDLRLSTIQNNRRKEFFEKQFTQFPLELISESGETRTETALQLNRLCEVGSTIRNFVNERVEQSIEIEDNWESLLNSVLKKEQQSEKGREEESRREKVKAIAKMASSKISVLTGGAGTGKTTTLAALCKSNAIQHDGILVLAPTGKARVVLSNKLRQEGVRAKTVFQFLNKSKHCDVYTWSYYLSGKTDAATPPTVIIDECSMLTEEMFAALIEAVRNAKRVIFVGDPNQLPPIGTGKPFNDLVQLLKTQEGQPHYANLLVSNRQKQGGTSNIRLDVELSKLFTDDIISHVQDDLFTQISLDSTNIEFIACKGADDVPQAIQKALMKIGITDIASFDKSLGGKLDGEWMKFNDATAMENWQILSPYRNKEVLGTRGINAYIQSNYRLQENLPNHTFTLHPLGTEGIRFGEKVIKIQNQDIEGYPDAGCENYVANGEIGIVERIWQKTKNNKVKKNTHQIRFSSQPNYCYNWPSKSKEEDLPLELAYALTIHKAQGSGFKATIFVLIEPEHGVNRLVTREMLYTALTRQSEKVFIIYNKEPSEIRKYSNVELSDLAFRKTNLFRETVLRETKDGWFDGNLIHTTKDGIRVRSKSEVIVYDMLCDAGFKPLYEQEIILDGITVHPDFTIEQSSGTVYWEHLGMLGDYMYRKSWERKKKLYAENNISEETANLILSQDELTGAIDAEKISDVIADKLKVDWSKVIETGLESKYLNSINVQGFATVIRSKFEKLLRTLEAAKKPTVSRYSQLNGRELIEFALGDSENSVQDECYKYWRRLNELIHNDMSEFERKPYSKYSLKDKRILLQEALNLYLKIEKEVAP